MAKRLDTPASNNKAEPEPSIFGLISSLHKASGTPTSLPFKLARDGYEKFN
jgi:hypothetical protein